MIVWIRALPYQKQVLIVYVMALFMTVIDSTMVSVALPSMANDFGVHATDVEWIAIGYILAVAAVIPPAGWLGDRFGTKRVLLWGLTAFTIVSLLCGLAQTLDQLVFLRVLQGLGGGLLVPIGSAMMFRAFPMAQRATAAVAVLTVAVIAPATGPVIGGLLVDQASWRWIFLINIPIGGVALVLGSVLLKEEIQDDPGRIDIAGLILSGGSVALLLYTMSIGPEYGWTSARVLTLGAIGVTALVAVIVIETHIANPLLKLDLFKDRLFRDVNISATMIYAGFFGFIFVVPLYLQALRGYSAFVSGLTSAPQALGVLLVSTLVGKRAYRVIGPRRLMVYGTAVASVVTMAFATIDLDTSLFTIGGLALIRGLAMGFVFIAMQTSIYATTSTADTGRASSLFNTQRQFSFATGVAIAATVLAAGVQDHGGDAAAIDLLPSYQHAFLTLGLIMLPGAFLSMRIRDDDVAETRGLEPVDAPGHSKVNG